MRYSNEQIAVDYARVAAEPSRHKAAPSSFLLIPWAFAIVATFCLFLAHRNGLGSMLFLGTLACAIGANVNWRERAALSEYGSARARLHRYEDALTTWQQAWRLADPRVRLPSSLALRDGESVVFCCRSKRMLEKKLGRRTDRYSSHSSDGVGTRSLAFGSIGLGHGIRVGVGGGPTTHHSTSSSEGHAFSRDVLSVEGVDAGELVITNDRFVFTGLRQTVEIPMSKIIGFHFLDAHDLIVDYAKRPAMESYTIPGPNVLSLCMMRRLGHASFEMPEPPEPLPLGTSPLVASATRLESAKAYAGVA